MPEPDGQLVAGIRTSDGALVFVEDVPPTLEIGDVVRCRLGEEQLLGTVSIPPRLVMWRDAAARCASFEAVEHAVAAPPAHEAREPIARFGSIDASPTGFSEKDMFGLAWKEIDRLDR